MTTQPVDRARRFALLLHDGSGDFDFVYATTREDTLYLDGHVPTYEHKRRAEELARLVGFEIIHNALRIYPAK